MLDPYLLKTKIAAARDHLRDCRLCPWQCRVDRLAGERGVCGQGPLAKVGHIGPHPGEETPLAGSVGAGAIFFSGCNLRCLYCQNHQISQAGTGEEMARGRLACGMLAMQQAGCWTLDLVSPTPHIPAILEALLVAQAGGLRLPIVYNTNAYLSQDALDLLEGVVDIYLPDLKYADDSVAWRLSQAKRYAPVSREALHRMFAQVGHLAIGPGGRAYRGILVRHLVLPGGLSQTAECLHDIVGLSAKTWVSLMSQYGPAWRASMHPPLDRPLTEPEYQASVEVATGLGLFNLFVQERISRDCGRPDFGLRRPFRWDDLPASRDGDPL